MTIVGIVMMAVMLAFLAWAGIAALRGRGRS